ncbi:MAG: hypothetical protein V4628_12265 [Pseudomonadota bacterium]
MSSLVERLKQKIDDEVAHDWEYDASLERDCIAALESLLADKTELVHQHNSLMDHCQSLQEQITALESIPAWAHGHTLSEDDLGDWLTEHAWDASEDSEPVYVVDREALLGLFKNTTLVLTPSQPKP